MRAEPREHLLKNKELKVRNVTSAPLLPIPLMLTIDQISQLTGVRKTTLRYWEKSFDEFLKPARTDSNRREYTLEDLDLVKTIKRLLEEEHLTSQGVRLKLGELTKTRV
jgi:hypothetical protein